MEDKKKTNRIESSIYTEITRLERERERKERNLTGVTIYKYTMNKNLRNKNTSKGGEGDGATARWPVEIILWEDLWREAVLKIAILDDGIESADLGLLLFALELDLKGGLATWGAIAREDGHLLGFPTTSTGGFAEDAGPAEGISIELAIRLFDEDMVSWALRREYGGGNGRGRSGVRLARESWGDIGGSGSGGGGRRARRRKGGRGRGRQRGRGNNGMVIIMEGQGMGKSTMARSGGQTVDLVEAIVADACIEDT